MVSLTKNTIPSNKLQSSNGEAFEVGVETGKQHVMIKTALEDRGLSGERLMALLLHQMLVFTANKVEHPPQG
jgi:hypothetical protein